MIVRRSWRTRSDVLRVHEAPVATENIGRYVEFTGLEHLTARLKKAEAYSSLQATSATGNCSGSRSPQGISRHRGASLTALFERFVHW